MRGFGNAGKVIRFMDLGEFAGGVIENGLSGHFPGFTSRSEGVQDQAVDATHKDRLDLNGTPLAPLFVLAVRPLPTRKQSSGMSAFVLPFQQKVSGRPRGAQLLDY